MSSKKLNLKVKNQIKKSNFMGILLFSYYLPMTLGRLVGPIFLPTYLLMVMYDLPIY